MKLAQAQFGLTDTSNTAVAETIGVPSGVTELWPWFLWLARLFAAGFTRAAKLLSAWWFW